MDKDYCEQCEFFTAEVVGQTSEGKDLMYCVHCDRFFESKSETFEERDSAVSFKEDSKERMFSYQEVILDLLRVAENEGVTTGDLVTITPRFGSVLHQLRAKGYNIVTKNIGRGIANYTLIGKSEAVKYTKGSDVIKEVIENEYEGIVTVEQLLKIMDEQSMNFVRKPNSLKA